MRFSISTLFVSAIIVPAYVSSFPALLQDELLTFFSVLAGYNCKCQDGSGQYNNLTEQICNAMKSQEAASSIFSSVPVVGGLFSLFTADATYHGDQVHQVRFFPRAHCDPEVEFFV